MVEDTEIKKKKSEIELLKKKLLKKIRVFELIRKGEIQKAEEILKKDKECLSYFGKFQHEMVDRNVTNYHVINYYIGGWRILYNPMYENEIESDLENLEKEIEEKENRLEQKIFLQKQQEYIEEQKEDIREGKKDRKRMQDFTFVLAFGVIATLLFNWFQIFIEFEYAQKAHLMIMGGIFIIIFTMLIFFVIYTMNMGKQIFKFVTDWRMILGVVLSIVIIAFLAWLLFVVQNKDVNQPENQNINFLNTSFQEFKDIQKNETILLNEILKTQNEILEEQIRINNRQT